MMSASVFSRFILLVGLCVVVPGVLGKESDDGKINNVQTVKSSSKFHEKDVISRRKRADVVDLAALQTLIQ